MFELAYMTGLPIDQVRAMDYTDYVKWGQYFERRPIGWREDVRTYHLLAAQGFKGKPSSIFESLAKIENASIAASKKRPNGFITPKQIEGSKMMSMIRKAKGGDSIAL